MVQIIYMMLIMYSKAIVNLKSGHYTVLYKVAVSSSPRRRSQIVVEGLHFPSSLYMFVVRYSQNMLVKVSIIENLLIDFCIHVIRE